jgi:hypothetical protein
MDNQTPQVPEDQIIAEMQCAYLDGIAKSDHTLCATGKACCEGMKAVLAVVRKHAALVAATESKDEWQARALKAEREVERLKLQSEHANAYWDDDSDFQSPEEYADEMDLKVGEEFELQAAAYWKLKFRVKSARNQDTDEGEYDCEQLTQRREEFPEYFTLKDQLAIAQREAANRGPATGA